MMGCFKVAEALHASSRVSNEPDAFRDPLRQTLLKRGNQLVELRWHHSGRVADEQIWGWPSTLSEDSLMYTDSTIGGQGDATLGRGPPTDCLVLRFCEGSICRRAARLRLISLPCLGVPPFDFLKKFPCFRSHTHGLCRWGATNTFKQLCIQGNSFRHNTWQYMFGFVVSSLGFEPKGKFVSLCFPTPWDQILQRGYAWRSRSGRARRGHDDEDRNCAEIGRFVFFAVLRDSETWRDSINKILHSAQKNQVVLCIDGLQVSKDGLLCDTWAGHTLKLELQEELQPVLDAQDDIPEELTTVPEAKATSGLEYLLQCSWQSLFSWMLDFCLRIRRCYVSNSGIGSLLSTTPCVHLKTANLTQVDAAAVPASAALPDPAAQVERLSAQISCLCPGSCTVCGCWTGSVFMWNNRAGVERSVSEVDPVTNQKTCPTRP